MKKYISQIGKKLSFLAFLTAFVLSPMTTSADPLADLFLNNASPPSGSVNLYMAPADSTLNIGDEITVSMYLDNSGFTPGADLDVQTVGIYVQFPADFLEVVDGSLSFAGSPFETNYQSSVDNTNGIIDIVRARQTQDALPTNTLIGSFRVQVKATATGTASITYASGQNSILLGDVNNTDVLGSATGAIIRLNSGGGSSSGGGTNQDCTLDGVTVAHGASQTFYSATSASSCSGISQSRTCNDGTLSGDSSFSNANCSNIASAGDARLWLTSDSGNCAVDNESVITIHMDTGSHQVSSAEIQLNYPSNLLQIDQSVVNVSGGVLSSSIFNTISPGVINMTLFNSGVSGITTSDGIVGTFTVKRIAAGNATISFGPSKVLKNDVANTDVFSGSGSPVTLATCNTANPIVEVCSLSPNPIGETAQTTLSFVTEIAGDMTLRQSNCSGAVVSFLSGGNTVTGMPITTTSSACGTGENAITIPAQNVGSPAAYTLAVCVDDGSVSGSDTTGLTIQGTTSSSSGGGGGSGGGRRTPRTPTPTPEPEEPVENACSVAKDLSARALSNGKILFTWKKFTDTDVDTVKLKWGVVQGQYIGSVILGNVAQVVLPASDLKEGIKYYFTIESSGEDCITANSNITSATKAEQEISIGGPEPEAPRPVAPTSPAGGPAGNMLIVLSIIGAILLRRKIFA